MNKLIIFVGCLIFISCQPNEKTNKTSQNTTNTTEPSEPCRYGKPVAIFSDTIPGITQQNFERNGQKGVETITFDDGTILEFYQEGCTSLTQEYRFAINGEYQNKDKDFWFSKAIELLTKVGRLDEKYAVIGIYVGTIEQFKPKMAIGQAFEVESNTFVTVDRIVDSAAAIVRIILNRKA